MTVQVLVVVTLLLSVLSWRDDDPHATLLGVLNDGIAIVSLVSDQVLGDQPLNQCTSKATVRSGSFCSKDSDRHTMRIHGQMYLGVKPPFVRPIPSLPPRAPAA